MLNNKTFFFIITTVAVILTGIFLDQNDDQFSWHDIIVEFHGLIFDLVVLGILLTIYENINDKKEKINRYSEEIDDFRHWKSDEAKFRIIGNIKRLYDLGVTKFNLMNCYLKDGDLQEYNFTGSNFYFANLAGSSLIRSNLTNCQIGICDLSRTHLVGTTFLNADLNHSLFNHAIITQCNFTNANLKNADFENSTINKSIFDNADMSNVILKNVRTYNQNWLQDLEQSKVIGIENILEKYYIEKSSSGKNEMGEEIWMVIEKTNSIAKD